MSPLYAAAFYGHSSVIRTLLRRGGSGFSRRAEVEARSAEGFTPLLIAAQEGHTEAVEVSNDGRGGTCRANFSPKIML